MPSAAAAIPFGVPMADPSVVLAGDAVAGPAPAANLPGQSLYVGELHPDVTEANLFELFSAVGPVASIRVCRDAVTRRSLGYAYVNFHNPFDAERALDSLNYTPVKGRACRIMWSQRDPALRKSGVGNIFIKNLDKSIDNKALHDTFSDFGNILSCKVVSDENSHLQGYGFVHFETAEAAELAIANVNGKLLMDKKVFVGHHVPRREREAKVEELRSRFTNIYVKNLDESVTSEELTELFSTCGTVTRAAISVDPETNRSRGFGFVNFENTEAAQKAVNELNGKEHREKKLFVCRAQKKSEREEELRRKFEHARQERLSKYTGINLYIKNLDDDINDERLRQEFSAYGTITSAKVMRDERDNSKGFGFVCFSNSEEATKAVTEMNGRIVGSKPLYVAIAQRKETRRAQLELQHSQRLQMRMQQQMAGIPNPMMYGPPVFFPPQQAGMPSQAPRMFPAPAHLRQQRWNGPMPGPMSGPITGPHQMPPVVQHQHLAQQQQQQHQALPQHQQQQQQQQQPIPNMQQFGRYPPVPQFMVNGMPPMQQMNRQGRQNNRGFRAGMTSTPQGSGRPLPNGPAPAGIPMQPRRFNKYGNNVRNGPINNGPDGAVAPVEGGVINPAEGLTAAALANMSPEQQKRTLGERLYPLVYSMDAERAGKVVGMLLELENTEVLRLIESPEELTGKVSEALEVLNKAAVVVAA